MMKEVREKIKFYKDDLLLKWRQQKDIFRL